MKALLVTVLAVGACKGTQPAPTFEFGRCDGNVGFQDLYQPAQCAEAKGKAADGTALAVDIRGTSVIVAIANNQTSTKLTAAGAAKTNPSSVEVSVVDKLKAATLEQIRGDEKVDLGVSVQVAMSGYAPAIVTVPPLYLSWTFRGPETAEQLLVKDKIGVGAAAPAAHTVLVASKDYPDVSVIGPAKTLGELDWVALVTSKQDTTGVCQYTEEGKTTVKDISTEVEVITVKLVDRYAGTVVDTHEFRPPAPCPDSLTSVGQLDIRFAFEREHWTQVKEWLTARIAK